MTHSSQAGLASLRAGVPVRVNSAVSRGMTPTVDEAARMYRKAPMFQPPSTRDLYMDAITAGEIPEDYDYLQFVADEAEDQMRADGDLMRKARREGGL